MDNSDQNKTINFTNEGFAVIKTQRELIDKQVLIMNEQSLLIEKQLELITKQRSIIELYTKRNRFENDI